MKGASVLRSWMNRYFTLFLALFVFVSGCHPLFTLPAHANADGWQLTRSLAPTTVEVNEPATIAYTVTPAELSSVPSGTLSGLEQSKLLPLTVADHENYAESHFVIHDGSKSKGYFGFLEFPKNDSMIDKGQIISPDKGNSQHKAIDDLKAGDVINVPLLKIISEDEYQVVDFLTYEIESVTALNGNKKKIIGNLKGYGMPDSFTVNAAFTETFPADLAVTQPAGWPDPTGGLATGYTVQKSNLEIQFKYDTTKKKYIASTNPSFSMVVKPTKVKSYELNQARLQAGSLVDTTFNSLALSVKSIIGVSISPVGASIDPGKTQQFQAEATYSDNTKKAITATAAWSSSDENIATITNGGLATGKTSGEVKISATMDGVTSEVSLKVNDVTPPAKPTVHPVSDKDTVVTGKAEPGSTVVVKKEDGTELGTEKADDNGDFSVTISTTQDVGTVLLVTATDEAGNESETTEVTVTATKVTGVILNKTQVSLSVGGFDTLVAEVQPSTANNKNVAWRSSNEAVATVDENGKVTGVGPGTATITVTTEEGQFTATCQITVGVPVTGVVLNKNSTALYIGDTDQLIASVLPADASNIQVTWGTSNSAVATVSPNGVVTAAGPGTAAITVTTVDGNFSATCHVSVTYRPISFELVKGSVYGNVGIAILVPTYIPEGTLWYINGSSNPITLSGDNVFMVPIKMDPNGNLLDTTFSLKAVADHVDPVEKTVTFTGGGKNLFDQYLNFNYHFPPVSQTKENRSVKVTFGYVVKALSNDIQSVTVNNYPYNDPVYEIYNVNNPNGSVQKPKLLSGTLPGGTQASTMQLLTSQSGGSEKYYIRLKFSITIVPKPITVNGKVITLKPIVLQNQQKVINTTPIIIRAKDNLN